MDFLYAFYLSVDALRTLCCDAFEFPFKNNDATEMKGVGRVEAVRSLSLCLKCKNLILL